MARSKKHLDLFSVDELSYARGFVASKRENLERFVQIKKRKGVYSERAAANLTMKISALKKLQKILED